MTYGVIFLYDDMNEKKNSKFVVADKTIPF